MKNIVNINAEVRSAERVAKAIVEDEPENLIAVYMKDGMVEVVCSDASRIELLGMLTAAQLELWNME